MCIIVYKPKGIEFPSKDILYNCYEYNNDGAGYMYPLDGNVEIKRGFFVFEKFYNSLVENTNIDMPVVMHFRISTAGKIDTYNCHPFPMTSDLKKFHDKEIVSHAGVAHNGIFSGMGNTKISDTVEFITKILAPCEKFVGHEGFDNMMNYTISPSKLIILYGDGLVKPYGKWIEDEGSFYSNSTYLTSYKVFTGSGWKKNCSAWDDDDYMFPYGGYSGGYKSYREQEKEKKEKKYEPKDEKTCPRCGSVMNDDVELYYGFCFDCLISYGYDPAIYMDVFECNTCGGLVFVDPDICDYVDEEDLLCCDCLNKVGKEEERLKKERNLAVLDICTKCGNPLKSSYEKDKGRCCDCLNVYQGV